VNITRIAEELARYLSGWIGYFGRCETPSVTQGLEEWIRSRLRSVIWKQWKRGSVRVAELRKCDVNKDLAARTAGIAHGPWRLARSRFYIIQNGVRLTAMPAWGGGSAHDEQACGFERSRAQS
jgi:hypothetical protein